ncbi:MAG: 2-hydroxyacyl-CoA dehydratase [Deltaproteobacteria bacterium]|nr:2-hydroxyacyl-CoA dehydratase [Deltaproteobacteria bacterium]MBW2219320.1 2-hydroxyacyl-CoA dehydratase [Deltaproteobacteria bacterium]
MANFDLFYEIINNPGQYAMNWKKETGNMVIGYFCSYAPEEIITAAGALPYRILAGSGSISKADAHLQAYSCSLVRGALEDALNGRLDFLEGTVFPNTCDSIQRLSDIWRMNAGFKFHADVMVPAKLNTQSARDYMTAVLEKFKKELEEHTGIEITEEKLKEAIDMYNGIRKNLSRLYAIRRDAPGVIKSSDIHAIFKAAMVMDRRQLLEELERLTADLGEKADAPDTAKKRIVLSGGLCSMPDIYKTIENSGGAVVWDDFCTGSRYFEGDIKTDGDPLKSISDRYMERVVCPAKHRGVLNRGEYLINAVKENRADGVIFLLLKFCDPHAFDYPYMKEMLEKENISSVLFEIEDQLPSEGQINTRCEAFMEML